MIIFQDLPVKPKYLLAFTVGVGQKAAINEAVQKVGHRIVIASFTKVYIWVQSNLAAVWLAENTPSKDCILTQHNDQVFGPLVVLLPSLNYLDNFAPLPK